MTQKKGRKKRSIVFSSNLDFQTTSEALFQSELVESFDFTGTRGKEGEGKAAEGGKLRATMKGWEPSDIMISSRGHIECWYYEDTSDINEIIKRLPEGCAYAYPEYTAVEAIRNTLRTLLIPATGRELCLQIVKSSIPRDYFEKLRSQRYERISSKTTDVKYVCSCGKSYVSKTWYRKHTKNCNDYNPSKSGLEFSGVLAKPGPVTVLGQSPYGIVKIIEMKTWEELKAAAERQLEIPLLLGHPRKPRW